MADHVVAGNLDDEATWRFNLVPAGGDDGMPQVDPRQPLGQRPAAELAEEIRTFLQQPIPGGSSSGSFDAP